MQRLRFERSENRPSAKTGNLLDKDGNSILPNKGKGRGHYNKAITDKTVLPVSKPKTKLELARELRAAKKRNDKEVSLMPKGKGVKLRAFAPISALGK